MIPIFDVLSEHISAHDISDLVEQGKIVTLPLAFMRGNTFKNCFALLDEAQNTTVAQMRLFLTRIGAGSKIVVTGDPEQSDLSYNNGFTDAMERLNDLPGLEIVHLDSQSVVRHPIIPDLERRYERKGEGKNSRI